MRTDCAAKETVTGQPIKIVHFFVDHIFYEFLFAVALRGVLMDCLSFRVSGPLMDERLLDVMNRGRFSA